MLHLSGIVSRQPRTGPDSVFCYPSVIPRPPIRRFSGRDQSSHPARRRTRQSRQRKAATPRLTASCPACSSLSIRRQEDLQAVARINGKLVNLDDRRRLADDAGRGAHQGQGHARRIADGEDPREAKQEAVRTASETVEVVARRFIERHAKANNRTGRKPSGRSTSRSCRTGASGRSPHHPARRDRAARCHRRPWRAPSRPTGYWPPSRKFFNWALRARH